MSFTTFKLVYILLLRDTTLKLPSYQPYEVVNYRYAIAPANFSSVTEIGSVEFSNYFTKKKAK